MFSIRARTLSGLSSFFDRSFGLSGSRCPSAHCPSPRGLRAARTGTVMWFASPGSRGRATRTGRLQCREVRGVPRAPPRQRVRAASEGRTHSAANPPVVNVTTGGQHEEAHRWRGLTRHATRIPQPARYDQGGAGHSRGVGRPARMKARRFFWAWPAGLMLVLSLYQIPRPALWADELATWGAVRLGWGGLFRLLGNVDAVVGPYFALMKAWTSVAGTSTFALRLPSVLAMVAATALLTILGGRLAGRRVGLLAGFAFALVPATSRYAQEARPYAFVILFAIVATLALTRLLDRPSWPRALLYGGSVAVLGAFHLVALLLLAAHGIVVGLRRGPAPPVALGPG